MVLGIVSVFCHFPPERFFKKVKYSRVTDNTSNHTPGVTTVEYSNLNLKNSTKCKIAKIAAGDTSGGWLVHERDGIKKIYTV